MEGSLKISMPQVYIGETENILVRLKQHLQDKDFWTECVAFISKNMLILIEIMKPVNHQYISLPVVSLTLPIQEVNATSNNPATIKYIQLITFIFCVQSS